MDNDTTQPTENTVSGSLQDTNAAQAGSVPAAVTSEPQVGGETRLAEPPTPAELAEEDARRADPVIRAWVRQNLSWLMAEIDHGRQGKTAEERTGLNP